MDKEENKLLIYQKWLEELICLRCESGDKFSVAKDSLTCTNCKDSYPLQRNFLDILTVDNPPSYVKELSARYGGMFRRWQDGKLGSTLQLYSKSVDEELEEFLSETNTSLRSLKGLRILDAGCGVARLSLVLSSKKAEVVALDINDELPHIASKNSLSDMSPFFIRGGIQHIPFGDCFDIVWCQGVLYYLEDPVSGVQEMKRVTKPGGKLYLWWRDEPLEKNGLFYVISRMCCGLPDYIRPSMLRVLGDIYRIPYGVVRNIKHLVCGQELVSFPDLRCAAEDISMARKISTIVYEDMMKLFPQNEWKKLKTNKSGGTITCLIQKLTLH